MSWRDNIEDALEVLLKGEYDDGDHPVVDEAIEKMRAALNESRPDCPALVIVRGGCVVDVRGIDRPHEVLDWDITDCGEGPIDLSDIVRETLLDDDERADIERYNDRLAE